VKQFYLICAHVELLSGKIYNYVLPAEYSLNFTDPSLAKVNDNGERVVKEFRRL
jgi:hypothetical protein